MTMALGIMTMVNGAITNRRIVTRNVIPEMMMMMMVVMVIMMMMMVIMMVSIPTMSALMT